MLAALTLVFVAAIYVGFALADGRAAALLREGMVALGFALAASCALWVTPWVAPAAFVAHAGWDALHHRRLSLALPTWYVPLCAVYDVVFAVGLVAIWL